MKYCTKIKNKNGLPYYKVNDLVFLTLGEAEVYCNKLNLDPNKYIEHEDEYEWLEKMKRVVATQLTTIDLLYDEIEKKYRSIKKEIEHEEKIINQSPSSKKILDIYLAEEKKRDLHNELCGIVDTLQIIRDFKQRFIYYY